jgi:hypothetical protein
VTGRGAGAVDHLGILMVAYLKDDDDLPLLALHLDRVARHRQVPTTSFVAAPRVSPAARALLHAQPDTVVCDLPATDLVGSREHAHYLDALLPTALAAGVSHICTLDVDSFPIRDDWLEVVTTAVPADGRLAGVCRRENRDTALPHPSCIVARRDFFESDPPSFSPDTDGTPGFREFRRATGQRADTGIRLGARLWQTGEPWGRLLRTNRRDAHYLMGGVYADAVFHLGGVGRGKLFRRDLEQSTIHRVTRPVERVPVGTGAVAQAKRRTLQQLRGRREAQLAARNRATYTVLRSWLLTDPDGLLAYLRGADGRAERSTGAT